MTKRDYIKLSNLCTDIVAIKNKTGKNIVEAFCKCLRQYKNFNELKFVMHMLTYKDLVKLRAKLMGAKRK